MTFLVIILYYFFYSNQPFQIDQTSGNVTINDAELIVDDIMEVIIIAKDNGIPPRQNHTIAFVRIRLNIKIYIYHLQQNG